MTTARRDAFHRLGVETVEDLLRLAPRRYEDRRRFDAFPAQAGGALAAPGGEVPADPSAGAFFAAAAAALPGSDLVLEGVCLNGTRLGFYGALQRMGARIDRRVTGRWCGEPVGTLRVRSGRLRGVRIGRRAVPSLIDEIPIVAVLAAGACRGDGYGPETTVVAAEARAFEAFVVDQTKQPIEGARVTLSVPENFRDRFPQVLDHSSNVPFRATTDAQGRVELAAVPVIPGSRLQAEHDGYAEAEQILQKLG